ncbi:MAG TPA: tetratricopeptide repeat protein [Myxococcota bacterium]|nr:tetratricopeptide repeat protein [Myxococcota bacterium]
MRVRCEKCGSEYNIDDARVPPEGLQIKCPKCLATFLVTKGGEAPQTAGDMFELGDIDLSDDPDGGSLELDLPEEGAPHTARHKSSMGGSTLPSIGGPGGAPGPLPSPIPSLPNIPGREAPASRSGTNPTPGAEGKIFDFIDHEIGSEDEAKSSGAINFRIRRKSGKVFGPFNADTVNKMLAEHQLMGNEEASRDGLTFKPLGAFDEFAQTIRLLMEEPVAGAPGSQASQSSVTGFDDEMASIETGIAPKGLEFAESPQEDAHKPGSGLLLGLAAGILIVIVGVSLGFTRYGFFAYRLLSGESTGSQNTDGGTALPEHGPDATSQARGLFFEDTYSGYDSLIRDLLDKFKDGDETKEERYMLALSLAAMLRNYGANEVFLARGRKVLQKMEEDDADTPECRKARAAYEILDDPVKANQELAPLVDKGSHDKEALYLSGWAMAYQKKWPEAARFFDRATVIDPDFAKAYHALGDIQYLQGDFDNAILFYQKALEKNPHHVNSAVEQAKILVEVKHDDKAGEESLKLVFGKQFAGLAPSEKSKAHALRAEINIHRHANDKVVQDLNAAIGLNPSRVEYKAALGNFFLDIGEYAKAEELFANALEQAPKNVDALVGKGRAMWQNGDIVKAKMFLEKIAADEPKDPRPIYLLGRIAEDLDKPDQALELFRKSAQISPKYLTARVAIARLYLKQDKLKDALIELTNAAKFNPRSAVVHNGLGEAYLKQGNSSLAEKEFKEALRLDPELASAYFNLGNVLRGAGKLDLAIERYQRTALLAPRYPDLALEQGYTLYLKKQFKQALKMYEEAIRENPKDDRLYVRAGMAAEASGDQQAAIHYYQSASGLNNSNSNAVFHLAILFLGDKEYEKAQELFKQVETLDPKNADAHFHMGECFKAQDMLSDAIDEFQLAININPGHIDASIELGKALAGRLQFDQAIDLYKRVVRAKPRRTDVRVALGDAYLQQGQLQQALKTLEPAYSRDPKFPGVAYKLGRVYDNLEKRSQAVKFYMRAVKNDPKDPMPHYYLGYVYKSTGNNKKARAEFKIYLRLRPDAPDADDVKDEMDYLR